MVGETRLLTWLEDRVFNMAGETRLPTWLEDRVNKKG